MHRPSKRQAPQLAVRFSGEPTRTASSKPQQIPIKPRNPPRGPPRQPDITPEYYGATTNAPAASRRSNLADRRSSVVVCSEPKRIASSHPRNRSRSSRSIRSADDRKRSLRQRVSQQPQASVQDRLVVEAWGQVLRNAEMVSPSLPFSRARNHHRIVSDHSNPSPFPKYRSLLTPSASLQMRYTYGPCGHPEQLRPHRTHLSR